MAPAYTTCQTELEAKRVDPGSRGRVRVTVIIKGDGEVRVCIQLNWTETESA